MFELQTPTADPLPWVTDRLRRAGAFIKVTEEVEGQWRRAEYGGWTRDKTERIRLSNQAASALLDILTQTVSALHDDEKPYVVVLSKTSASAGTLLERRVVEVGSKPMNDDTLSDGQKAAVMAGLALHEVGHIRFGRQYDAAVTRMFGKGAVTGAIRALSNLAADMHDESAACRVFPGLAAAIPVTLWWVGGKNQQPKVSGSDRLTTSAAERVNMAIAATRYPWQVEWDTQEAREWREWWVSWGERAAEAGQPKRHAEVVKEGIDKIREQSYVEQPSPTRPQPKPQPQPIAQERDEQEQAPGRDMSDEQPEQDEPGEPEQAPSSGDDAPEGDEQQQDEAQAGGDENEGPEGPEAPQQAGGDEPAETSHDGEQDDESERGSLGGKTYDADESRVTDDSCVKHAATDPQQDSLLQQGAEFVNRGKREGMRIRVYHHKVSHWGEHGRRVIAHGKKGSRWVQG